MKTQILGIVVLATFLSVACSSPTKKAKQKTETETPVANVEMVYHVEGMTCDHCEMSIQKGVNELDGIVKVEANHEDSTTMVIFDPSKTNKEQIAQAIEKRGYSVVE